MNYDTTNRPVNIADIKLKMILDKARNKRSDFNDEDTSIPLPKDPNDTSVDGNGGSAIIDYDYCYNRKVCRYAKKHKITCKEAFKRLYK